jgi:2-polyprenyl-6-methoxyphenol hydroxylase-like FAD-dependent oxidoreductase
MSPFKGQGANQALLDAVNLAQALKQGLDLQDPSKISEILRKYEKQMIDRTRTKILSSRESVLTLHNPDFVKTGYQLERRGFNDENNKDMIRNLKIVQDMGILASDPSTKLDLYAFASV